MILHRSLTLIPLFFTLLSIQCTNSTSLPEETSSYIRKGFISGSIPEKGDLNKRRITKQEFDSVLREYDSPGTGAMIKPMRQKNNQEWRLGFFVPDGLKQDTLYPLLIYLHGGTGTARNNKGEKAWEMFSFLTDSIDILLASPSASAGARWWSPQGMERILKTLRYISLYYPVDPERVILAGVSDGGTACYAAAGLIPGPFCGFIPVSGYGGMIEKMGIELAPENLMQRPVYNINAGRDRLYPLDSVNSYIDKLEDNGVNISTSYYPEEEHGFSYKEEEVSNLLEIIDEWRRPNQEGISWTITMSQFPNRAHNLISWTLEEAESKGRVQGYWDTDTLYYTCSGIESFLFYPPFKRENIHASERKKEISAKKLKLNVYNVLRYIIFRGIPEYPENGMFLIERG